MRPREFRNIFAILHNTERDELMDAGVMSGDQRSWERFNSDLTTFVLKLDDARLAALVAFVASRQPKETAA